MVYQNVDEVNEDYGKLKQKIVTWTSNKVANEGVPMDIGKVGWHGDDGDYEVAAVGQRMQCYNCGGWGHQSRECQSDNNDNDKGKGKGTFGDNLGKGGKNFGKGGKDFGKGGQRHPQGVPGGLFQLREGWAQGLGVP